MNKNEKFKKKQIILLSLIIQTLIISGTSIFSYNTAHISNNSISNSIINKSEFSSDDIISWKIKYLGNDKNVDGISDNLEKKLDNLLKSDLTQKKKS